MTFDSCCRQLVAGLARTQRRLVLAESCTGGLIAATLARQPGVSEYFCGSAVTYRNATKQAWLQVDETLLANPGPVSAVVAERMAVGVLQQTPEAAIAAAVTGHLGPHAPRRLDGVIFIAVSRRDLAATGRRRQPPCCETRVVRRRLRQATRIPRQREAMELVLAELLVSLNE